MRLKEIATVNPGYPFRGKILEKIDSPVIVVQMKDISLNDGIRWAECTQTTLLGKRKPDYLAVGDILVAARGSHNYAVQVDSALLALPKKAVAAPHFFEVRLKNNEVIPEFIVWLLNQNPVQRYFEQNAEGSLTKSIRRGVLEEAPIVVPPLAEQQTIVAMANILHQEQRLVTQLVQNGERIMNTIAKKLHKSVGV